MGDGVIEGEYEIEIHASSDSNEHIVAWHAIIKGRLAHGLRFPSGKEVSVVLPTGGIGTGMLVDPQLIRGTGTPPC